MCPEGEYPVRADSFPASGRACVEEGREPPSGYRRFPAGHVPHWVDDDYDPTAMHSPGG